MVFEQTKKMIRNYQQKYTICPLNEIVYFIAPMKNKKNSYAGRRATLVDGNVEI